MLSAHANQLRKALATLDIERFSKIFKDFERFLTI
jgi:hypothetical protein